MIKLTLKDGSVREIESAQSAAEIVKGIGMGLYKAACCVKINGETKDLRTVVDADCTFEVLTFDSLEGKKTFWHTASHVLAQAVKRLYPTAKLAIGPAIDTGFYYDFDLEKPFTTEDLSKIEAEMKKIVKANIPLTQFELSPEEAIAKLQEMDEPYKVELCQEHAEKGEPISFYQQDEFVDLCAGPHLMATGTIKAFKLLSCTGAYWRGSEKNKMLSRVYAVAFPKAAMLEEHLAALEEAKQRDHNKLGRELEYFTTVDVVGQGLPILLPKGARVVQLLQRWVEDVEQAHGYLLTKTPLMAKREFYKISGHWDHYLDGMFILGDPYDEEKECFALRPMTCPFQYQVYLNRARSYRDLPMRLGETSTLFRNEDSGEMHGLIRVRQFTISEGHLVLRPDQLEEEFKDCLALAKYFLDTVGLLDACTFRFSQWDPANPGNKYEGNAEQWEEAQRVMGNILDHLGVSYEIGIDEAAFYGPKLDFMVKDAIGRKWQLGTIQVDYNLPERFDLTYKGADDKMHRPIMIHRAPFGSMERFVAVLLEHTGGKFPLWLSPDQVVVLPISEKFNDYAEKVSAYLNKYDIRSQVDDRNEKIGRKIRDNELKRIPYLLIVGEKEEAEGLVSVRAQGEGDKGQMTLEAFRDYMTDLVSHEIDANKMEQKN